MARWQHAVLGAIVALLAGCGGPAPPPPTTVMLTLNATADVNPTPDGQGAPVVVRVYELAATTAFDGAAFFDLFNQDQATLKGDLVKREEVTLVPGQRRTLTLTLPDQASAVGVFGAFRDYAGVVWRVHATVPPHQTTRLSVQAGKAGLSLNPPGS
jgi:type VI secretion system protein VasD